MTHLNLAMSDSLRGRLGPLLVLVAALSVAIAISPASPLRAENRLEIGYAEGSPGDRGVAVTITSRHDVAIHGFSLAVRYPASALELTDFGVEGTHVSELAPDFVAPTVDPELGIAVLGVIFNYDEPAGSVAMDPVGETEAPRIVARLLFDVKGDAEGGVYPLEFVEGGGDPPAYNRLTARGQSIHPDLTPGSFRVEGGDALAIEKRQAIPGATPNLPLFAYAQHAQPLAGFSIGLSYDCGALDLLEASYVQTSLAFELGSVGLIEFYQSDIDEIEAAETCRSRTAAIFDYAEPYDCQTMPPSPNLTDQSLMRYRFKVLSEANAEKEYQTLALEQLSDPIALNNAFLIDACPEPPFSTEPRLVDGRIYFSTGQLEGRVVESVSGDPVPGADVVTDPDGFTARTDIEGRFTLESLPAGPYDLRVRSPGYYPVLSPGHEVTGKGGTDTIGDLAVYAIPRGPGRTFRRGFVNPDRKCDISDAVWILSWLFKGGTPPTCMLAADANADNRTDISDAVWLLNYLFTGGTPPPPPFEECGQSPGGDVLTCESNPVCD